MIYSKYYFLVANIFYFDFKYETVKNLVQQELKNAVKCSISTDSWTSIATESFLGVTCHYVTKMFKFKSLILCLQYLNDDHNSQFIFGSLNEILDSWSVGEKVLKFFINLLISN